MCLARSFFEVVAKVITKFSIFQKIIQQLFGDFLRKKKRKSKEIISKSLKCLMGFTSAFLRCHLLWHSMHKIELLLTSFSPLSRPIANFTLLPWAINGSADLVNPGNVRAGIVLFMYFILVIGTVCWRIFSGWPRKPRKPFGHMPLLMPPTLWDGVFFTETGFWQSSPGGGLVDNEMFGCGSMDNVGDKGHVWGCYNDGEGALMAACSWNPLHLSWYSFTRQD